jgi:hypothetical protein
MKRLLLLFLLIATIAISNTNYNFNTITFVETNSDYCQGWKAGYKAGYCYEKVYCLEPLTPLCPLPQIGRNSYEDGYNDGFVKGRRDSR